MTSLDLTTSTDAAKRSERLSQWTRVLCVLFFFSGFPALIYQLTWQRQLFLIFGVNIESVTIVVTAFMLGLGVGSLAGGWLSNRRGIRPLPLLAAIELLTGAFGVVSLTIFDKVGEWMIGLSLPATAAGSLGLVIVPTLLMGATLPVLVSHLVRRSGNIGSAVGLLYYVNTLGAGAACLVCALLLFPFLGMSGSIYVAAAINFTVAVGALAAHWLDGREPDAIMPNPATFLERRGPALGLAKVSRIGGGRRVRLAFLRNIFLPHRFLRHGIERDRLRRYAERFSGRDCVGLAASRRKLRNGARARRSCGAWSTCFSWPACSAFFSCRF